LSALQDNELYEQSPAFENTTRYYGAFRFDPQIFGKDSHTSIRGDFERGQYTADAPRDVPPADEITPWFQSTITVGGVTNPGYNKITENQFSNTNPTAGGPVPGASGGPESANYFQLGGWAEGRVYWPDVVNYFEATPQSVNTVASSVPPGGDPFFVITGQANTGLANNGNGIGGISTFRPDSIPPFSNYAQFIGVNDTIDGYNEPFQTIPGGVYYTDKLLTDPSIFNFYKKLLDGPNKHEWKSWTAFNLTLDQTFFDDRLGIEVAYDQQKYTEGAEPWLQGQNYAIAVDINQTYADGTPNPNVGRPEVAQAASGGEDDNYQTTTSRQVWRITPTLEIRGTDIFGNSKIAEIFGKQVFTGLFEKNTVIQSTFQFAEYATSNGYEAANTAPTANAVNAVNSNGSFEWMAYIGPSLFGNSSASGLKLNNLNYVIAPPRDETTLNFNSTWNKPTAPNAPGYVDPTAPYTYINTVNGSSNTSTQVNNPANYIGWSNEAISYLTWADPADRSSLATSGQRTHYQDESEGLTWQGYLFDGDLVPSLGWRKDKITNYYASAITNTATGFTSLDYPDDPNSRTDVNGVSKTWGGVYHFPKSIMSKLPGDLTFSIFGDRSENFKPDAQRLSLAGLPVPNASGTTTEYGFMASALGDRISLKVDWFKTLVKNASLGETSGNSIAGLGSNAYFVADGMIWGYGWAAALQDGLKGANFTTGKSTTTPNTNYWDYGNGSGLAFGTPAYIALNQASQQIINAWINVPIPDSFFQSYNLAPAIKPSLAKASGQLDSAFLNGYNDLTAQTTVDNLSKGVEIELTTQILRNWNFTLNYTHVNATHTNIDPITTQFLSIMSGFMNNGAGGQLREWYNGGPTIASQWNSSIIAPYTVQLNDQGHEAPEVSPWRLNFITTYNVDRGPAKGAFIGGALRVEAARILGYKYDPTFKNVNSTDPNYANVLAVTEGGLNVNEPFYGPNDTHVDLWFGYQRKVYKNVNWRIQLNLSNVGEKDHIVPVSYEPDGSMGLARIELGMGWRLENSFDF
jgi:hypothetical protein